MRDVPQGFSPQISRGEAETVSRLQTQKPPPDHANKVPAETGSGKIVIYLDSQVFPHCRRCKRKLGWSYGFCGPCRRDMAAGKKCERCGTKPRNIGGRFCRGCERDITYRQNLSRECGMCGELMLAEEHPNRQSCLACSGESLRERSRIGSRRYADKTGAAAKRVNRLVIAGQLPRPNKCEKCDCVVTPRKDGCSGIHGHHDDYNKPFEVRWLCPSCHFSWHRDNKPIPLRKKASVA